MYVSGLGHDITFCQVQKSHKPCIPCIKGNDNQENGCKRRKREVIEVRKKWLSSEEVPKTTPKADHIFFSAMVHVSDVTTATKPLKKLALFIFQIAQPVAKGLTLVALPLPQLAGESHWCQVLYKIFMFSYITFTDTA